jgi:hypothetical protein
VSGLDYFAFTNLQANTLARASDVNARIAAVQGGFAKLPLPDKIRENRVAAVVDEGITNALIISLDVAPAAYNFGLELAVRIANTNTGPASVNVNGLGVKTIKRADGSPILAGDLPSGCMVKLIYDGSDFRMIGATENSISASVAAAAASVVSAAASATAAATSATAAAASATNAAASATAAAASAVAAGLAATGYLPLAGGTMTGALTLSGAPTSNLHAATKKYVDDIAIAAGSFTADGASISLVLGQFSLTPIADQRVLGNVSGGTAKPTALTGNQLVNFLPAFGSSTGGLCPPTSGAVGAFLRSDATWQQITTVSGNAGTATKLATARTIAISGAVTGTGTAFDGSANITIPITALDVGAATTGVLAVARGGTGVTTSTGSGSNVLSNAPTFTGILSAATILTSVGLAGGDITANRFDGTGVFYFGGSGTRYLAYDGANYVFNSALVGLAAPPAGNSNVWAVNSAWVQNELTGYSKALLTITSISSDRTIANGDNNALLQCTGGTSRTLTAGNLNTGLSVLIAVTGSVAWTFSCAGGVYLSGSTSTVTSVSIPAGSQCTAIHLGGGVWLLSGL